MREGWMEQESDGMAQGVRSPAVILELARELGFHEPVHELFTCVGHEQ
jgi:hypothetical protein